MMPLIPHEVFLASQSTMYLECKCSIRLIDSSPVAHFRTCSKVFAALCCGLLLTGRHLRVVVEGNAGKFRSWQRFMF